MKIVPSRKAACHDPPCNVILCGSAMLGAGLAKCSCRSVTAILSHAMPCSAVQDLIAAGIIDPAKVTRSGLTNACGIAGIMLTTQVRAVRVVAHRC